MLAFGKPSAMARESGKALSAFIAARSAFLRRFIPHVSACKPKAAFRKLKALFKHPLPRKVYGVVQAQPIIAI